MKTTIQKYEYLNIVQSISDYGNKGCQLIKQFR